MTGQESLRHEFVEFIPNQLEHRVLYVSMEYATTAHKCACGCGSEVFTPLSPTDWKLIFDGETVSLKPSIGNWSFECQSHYWIEEGRIRWAPQWSREQIDRGRELDRLAKERHAAAGDQTEPDTHPAQPSTRFFGWLERVLGRGGSQWPPCDPSTTSGSARRPRPKRLAWSLTLRRAEDAESSADGGDGTPGGL